MEKEKRDQLIHKIGEQLAAHCKGYHGSIQFNIFNGKYVNANLSESIKPIKKN
jgi:hypothetical protein